MKRIFTGILAVMMLFLGGCGFWMDGEHFSVTPHENQVQQGANEVISANSYAQMRKILTEQIEQGVDSTIIAITSFNDATMHFYVDTAIRHILEDTPVGAYAVNDITYTIGTNQGKPVVAFQVDYRHGAGEILRIKQASDIEAAGEHLAEALRDCVDSVVLRVKNYRQTDIAQVVQDYGNLHPDQVMEIPQVRVSVYPDSGTDRVIEVYFTYQNSRDDLRSMQTQVDEVFTSAELYVKQTKVKDSFSRLYSFLMERDDYTLQTSITPAYSLLCHGVGDSRAFANVYAAMCARADLECRVVSGTKDQKPWTWNVVRYRGEYYHVDLLECSKNGSFQMLSSGEMDGYVWDYSAF